MLDIKEAIRVRHSVRTYLDKPLPEDVKSKLEEAITEVNAEGNLHIQLITNEPKAFLGMSAYGKFKGVSNYFICAAKPAPDVDERIGYYGEKLVLLAQQLGLNTCWVGLTYKKIMSAYQLAEGEKVICAISLGYGKTMGPEHKIKSITDVSNATSTSPAWFVEGVKSALLAPTAINQQKFYFEFREHNIVEPSRLFSMVGYTLMDLGIAKLHFEIGAGKDNFIFQE